MNNDAQILWHVPRQALLINLSRFDHKPVTTRKVVAMTYQMFKSRHLMLTASFLKIPYSTWCNILNSNKPLPRHHIRAIRFLYTIYRQLPYNEFIKTFRNYSYNIHTKKLERSQQDQ